MTSRVLLEVRLNLFAVLQARVTSENDNFSRLSSRQNLHELRRLDAGVDRANVDCTRNIDGVYLIGATSAIDCTDRYGDCIRSISKAELDLGVHAGNQIALGVLQIDFRRHGAG